LPRHKTINIAFGSTDPFNKESLFHHNEYGRLVIKLLMTVVIQKNIRK